MTPAALERVFGRTRLRMVTGQYVEVFRERAAPGERRRYTKRFLSTDDGDFREWTEREWRMLARLVGHGLRHVPDVVQFDRGSNGESALVQTYDAGVTIDHWQSLLPVERDGRVLSHVFQDCAHWWALAHHFLLALQEIHQLKLVHLDLKADNVCIPLAPSKFDPFEPGQPLFPVFKQIALIDFAFSLISGERIAKPLPIGWQREYPYQSPRLLKALVAGRDGDLEPTRALDWRCDLYSLAAMLKRYLPAPEKVRRSGHADGWTDDRFFEAKVLILKLHDCHDREASRELPHPQLVELCNAQLRQPELDRSLNHGWTLAAEWPAAEPMAPTVPVTPVTRIERQVRPITLVDEVVLAPARAVAPAAEPVFVPMPASVAEPTEPLVAAPVAASEAVTATPPNDLPTAWSAEPAEVDVVPPAHPVPMPMPMPDRIVLPSPPPTRPRFGRMLAYAAALAVAIAVWPFLGGTPKPAVNADRTVAEAGNVVPVVTQPAPATKAPRPVEQPARPVVDAAAAPPAVPAPATASTPAPAVMRPEVPAATEAPAVADVADPADATGRPPAVAVDRAPSTPPDDARAVRPITDAFTRRADGIVNSTLPVVAKQAATGVEQVLQAAAVAEAPAQDRKIVDVVRSMGENLIAKTEFDGNDSPSSGRQLNAAAREAFWTRGDVAAALQLQLRAFGANPQDSEIAGNLAFYYLKANPPQPEIARQLSMHALAAATERSKTPRYEDWGNLAVASALSGRQQDATNAMLVLLAVSRDVNRTCRSALSAVASFGAPMKAPAEAMFARIRSRGAAAADAPYCAWPPKWEAGMKFP